MPRIFLSYRREDSIDVVGRMYDRLERTFGKENIFWDQSSIPAGASWRSQIFNFLETGGTCLIIIGPKWLQSFQQRPPESDVLLDEIKFALNRSSVRVIPVLVSGASMPPKADLPSEIDALSGLQAAPMRSGADFERDIQNLMRQIQHHQPNRGGLWGSLPLTWKRLIGALTLVSLVVGTWASLVQVGALTPLSQPTQSSAVVPTITQTDTVSPPATETDAPPGETIRSSPSVASPSIFVSRDFDGIQICTREQASLTEMKIEFIGANETYTLGQVFPPSRQNRLEGQGCVCLIRGEVDLPPQCTAGNSSEIQDSQSDWVNVTLALTLRNETCFFQAGCQDDCTCENQ